MRLLGVLTAILLLILIGGIGFVAYAWEPAIDPIEPPPRTAFDAATIARGAQLAAVGNCIVCHTVPDGAILGGGLPLPTPFGTIYSTNITPDAETGIGRWSEQAFARSMRRGVDREGRHLYPAFPYDHFTRVTDDDNRALYAYLMTRQPARAPARANELHFPYNVRPLIAGWKLLFFHEGPQRPVPSQSAEWNRGAYLAEGLDHCGACHTPRNRFGAEKEDEHFSGGEAEGWYAYAINASSPAPVPWTVDSLAFYLRHGWHEHHGVSRGPMAPVTTNLASIPDSDVRAIATYVIERMGPPSPEKKARAEQVLARAQPQGPGRQPNAGDSQTSPGSKAGGGQGGAIYMAACATCHDSGRPLPYGGLSFHLSTAVNGPNPDNIINVVLHGLPAAEGERSPIMPGFDGVISDAQLADLLAYLRATFSDKPPWPDVAGSVVKQRERRDLSIRANDTGQAAPASPRPRGTSW